MSTMGSHIRAAETGRTHTASICLALVDRAADRLENEQASFRRQRAEMREAIKQSGPKERITKPSDHCGRLGAGITKGLGRGRHLTEAAIAVVREYVASEGMKIEDAARRAQVSTESVKKYARLRRVAREAARADWFSAQQWTASTNTFLAGSGAGAGRSEKRAAEAGEETPLSPA